MANKFRGSDDEVGKNNQGPAYQRVDTPGLNSGTTGTVHELAWIARSTASASANEPVHTQYVHSCCRPGIYVQKRKPSPIRASRGTAGQFQTLYSTCAGRLEPANSRRKCCATLDHRLQGHRVTLFCGTKAISLSPLFPLLSLFLPPSFEATIQT